jgi:hypothetical protein
LWRALRSVCAFLQQDNSRLLGSVNKEKLRSCQKVDILAFETFWQVQIKST